MSANGIPMTLALLFAFIGVTVASAAVFNDQLPPVNAQSNSTIGGVHF